MDKVNYLQMNLETNVLLSSHQSLELYLHHVGHVRVFEFAMGLTLAARPLTHLNDYPLLHYLQYA